MVFQSSIVGVLLADPNQAIVEVEFEGKAAGEPDDIAHGFVSNNKHLDHLGVIYGSIKLVS